MITRIEPSAQPSRLTPRQVEREFRSLIADGARIRPAGEARADPLGLLSEGYTPKYKIELFDTIYYLTNIRQNPDIRFFVTYVVQRRSATGRVEIYPRIFYKDISLVWRSASHFVSSDTENWIGKGDVETIIEDGEEMVCSFEQTTDLPLEIQTALEELSRTGPEDPGRRGCPGPDPAASTRGSDRALSRFHRAPQAGSVRPAQSHQRW